MECRLSDPFLKRDETDIMGEMMAKVGASLRTQVAGLFIKQASALNSERVEGPIRPVTKFVSLIHSIFNMMYPVHLMTLSEFTSIYQKTNDMKISLDASTCDRNLSPKRRLSLYSESTLEMDCDEPNDCSENCYEDLLRDESKNVAAKCRKLRSSNRRPNTSERMESPSGHNHYNDGPKRCKFSNPSESESLSLGTLNKKKEKCFRNVNKTLKLNDVSLTKLRSLPACTVDVKYIDMDQLYLLDCKKTDRLLTEDVNAENVDANRSEDNEEIYKDENEKKITKAENEDGDFFCDIENDTHDWDSEDSRCGFPSGVCGDNSYDNDKDIPESKDDVCATKMKQEKKKKRKTYKRKGRFAKRKKIQKTKPFSHQKNNKQTCDNANDFSGESFDKFPPKSLQACRRDEERQMHEIKNYFKNDKAWKHPMLSDCYGCYRMCESKVSETDRAKIHDAFWSLDGWKARRDWISSHVDKLIPNDIVAAFFDGYKNVHKKYFLPDACDATCSINSKVEVCGLFFRNTLGVKNSKLVEYIVKPKPFVARKAASRLDKMKNRKCRKLPEHVIRSVENYMALFKHFRNSSSEPDSRDLDMIEKCGPSQSTDRKQIDSYTPPQKLNILWQDYRLKHKHLKFNLGFQSFRGICESFWAEELCLESSDGHVDRALSSQDAAERRQTQDASNQIYDDNVSGERTSAENNHAEADDEIITTNLLNNLEISGEPSQASDKRQSPLSETKDSKDDETNNDLEAEGNLNDKNSCELEVNKNTTADRGSKWQNGAIDPNKHVEQLISKEGLKPYVYRKNKNSISDEQKSQNSKDPRSDELADGNNEEDEACQDLDVPLADPHVLDNSKMPFLNVRTGFIEQCVSKPNHPTPEAISSIAQYIKSLGMRYPQLLRSKTMLCDSGDDIVTHSFPAQVAAGQPSHRLSMNQCYKDYASKHPGFTLSSLNFKKIFKKICTATSGTKEPMLFPFPLSQVPPQSSLLQLSSSSPSASALAPPSAPSSLPTASSSQTVQEPQMPDTDVLPQDHPGSQGSPSGAVNQSNHSLIQSHESPAHSELNAASAFQWDPLNSTCISSSNSTLSSLNTTVLPFTESSGQILKKEFASIPNQIYQPFSSLTCQNNHPEYLQVSNVASVLEMSYAEIEELCNSIIEEDFSDSQQSNVCLEDTNQVWYYQGNHYSQTASFEKVMQGNHQISKRVDEDSIWRKGKKNRLKKSNIPMPMLSPCMCQRFKCHEKFTEEERGKIHEMFWSLKGYQARKQWMLNHMLRKDVKDRRTDKPIIESRRKQTLVFYLPSYKSARHTEENTSPFSSDEKRVHVCKRFFLRTLGYQWDSVLRSIKETTPRGATTTVGDRRGRKPPKHKLPAAVRNCLFQYCHGMMQVAKTKLWKAHRINCNLKKQYVDAPYGLSVKDLYNDYRAKHSEHKLSYATFSRSYRRVWRTSDRNVLQEETALAIGNIPEAGAV